MRVRVAHAERSVALDAASATAVARARLPDGRIDAAALAGAARLAGAAAALARHALDTATTLEIDDGRPPTLVQGRRLAGDADVEIPTWASLCDLRSLGLPVGLGPTRLAAALVLERTRDAAGRHMEAIRRVAAQALDHEGPDAHILLETGP